jgi:DNA (cytosine-5)-methyltransferase 1
MNELALFAGAGGGILGGHLLGWRTVCAVEWEPYPASVLCARQNDGFLPPFPIWDDVQTFDGKPWRGIVDVVSGGFPCQDISIAGQGAGLEGERSGMWKQMARIIGEVRPRHAFIENSPMLTIRGLDRVLCDLAALGYDAQWGVISAADCGAPHKRERIWIVAYATQLQRNGGDNNSRIGMESGQVPESGNSGRAQDMADTTSERQQRKGPSWFGSDPAEAREGETDQLSQSVSDISGALNPLWVEWLMGWPLGWTDLKPLEMDKFQSWLRAHLGGCDE